MRFDTFPAEAPKAQGASKAIPVSAKHPKRSLIHAGWHQQVGAMVSLQRGPVKPATAICQGKVEMSCFWPSRFRHTLTCGPTANYRSSRRLHGQ